MKTRRSQIVEMLAVLALCGFAVWFFCFSGIVFSNAHSNASNRKSIIQIHEAVQLGDSPAEVRSAFQQFATKDLRLHDEQPVPWIIRMPLEVGASDWTLRIVVGEGRVTAVQVRTSDGPLPKNGPPDKQAVPLHRNVNSLPN